MPWKAPICAPWSYTCTRRLDFSIRALDMNMDKEQAERGQTPEWLREHSTCWLPWFFTVFLPFLLSFSSSSHPSTAWCSGRWVFPWQSWEAKNLNFRTLERVPSVMLTPLSVMLEYSWELMGQNKKISPHWKKVYIAVDCFISFQSTWERVLVNKISRKDPRKRKKVLRLSIFNSF